MPEEYTNRELGILLKDVSNDIKEIKKTVFGNGKPGILERLSSIEKWKATLIGGFTVITLIVIPIAIKVASEIITKK